MISRFLAQESNLVEKVFQSIVNDGVCVVEDVLPQALLAKTRLEMYSVQNMIESEIGIEKLIRANERGVLRLMLKSSDHFLKFLQIPQMISIADKILSDTCIMHLQNGFILPTATEKQEVFQYRFHRDFPRILNGYVCSLNIMFAIDEFRKDNGATKFVLGSHQRENHLTNGDMDRLAVAGTCSEGAMVIFDSTIMHAAGQNQSGQDRLAINHQFTRSYFKQQLDYVRALGNEKMMTLDERTQQLLGWYTRIPTSLEEYYVPSTERLYRAGQG